MRIRQTDLDFDYRREFRGAMPEAYGSSGVNTFQVNEGGVIYGLDQGQGYEVWAGAPDWTGGNDPTTAATPWRVVQ